MLRRGRFNLIETTVAWIFAVLLFASGFGGIAVALIKNHWLPGLAGLGILTVGVLYLLAALRRRPL